MKFRLFGCGKFSWLVSAAEDRPLTDREERFMERHRLVCRDCAGQEEASALALNMLRQVDFGTVETDARFDRRVIRRVRSQAVRGSLNYWSPALYGAAIAAVALVAALQLLARSSELPVFKTANTDARRIEMSNSQFPQIRIMDRISGTD